MMIEFRVQNLVKSIHQLVICETDPNILYKFYMLFQLPNNPSQMFIIP